MTKTNKLLFKIVLTAIFTALSFSLTFVSVPLPTGAKVHLGNFVLVVAALLFGGLVGGASGGLGMMFNDIALGFPTTTVVRTLIVKFIFGLVVGVLFRLFIKRNKTTRIVLYSTTAIFIILSIVTIVLFANANNYKDANALFDIGYKNPVKMSVLVPIFASVFAVLLTVASAFSFKLSDINVSVLTVTTLGVVVNTLLEFFIRILFNGIATSNFYTAYLESVSKIPSNLITGVLTIILATALFLPVYNGLKNEKKFKEVSNIGVIEDSDDYIE
ncbi:MAG: ECF transporter S component [Acholeplasmatales bacterium]|nr:ECF transporter S component [Acholeplasmatales bacterium]